MNTLHENDIKANIEFFRKYLAEKELSESDFATVIGGAHRTVNHILNGKHNPGSKFIVCVLRNCEDITFEQAFSYTFSLPKGNKNNSKSA